jgi:hypothetical protein
MNIGPSKVSASSYPFESKSLISDEIFEQSIGDVRIEDNGYVAVCGTSMNNGEVRGKQEYTTGKHRLRFRFEKKSAEWIFIGIISKATPMKQNSYESRSSYGWISCNYYYAGGLVTKKGDIFSIDDNIENDTIEFLINATARTLQYTNERTNQTHQMWVDIQSCPLPWQVLVHLAGDENRIRLLRDK